MFGHVEANSSKGFCPIPIEKLRAFVQRAFVREGFCPGGQLVSSANTIYTHIVNVYDKQSRTQNRSLWHPTCDIHIFRIFSKPILAPIQHLFVIYKLHHPVVKVLF